MNKQRSYFPLDEAPQGLGDGLWRGVNARLDPAQLGQGWAADAGNCRFDTGWPATRKGVAIMAWGSNVGGGDGLIIPFEDALCAGTFSNPVSGFEWQVVVTEDAAYRIRPGNVVQTIPVAAGESLAGATDLLQTYDGLLLLRGREAQPLTLANFDDGFETIPSPPSGLEPIPPLTQAIYFQERVIGVDARVGVRYADSFWVSDIGGQASNLYGERVYQNFKINRGSADRLVTGYKFSESTLIALKERSVHVIYNVKGTNEELEANAVLDTVTDEYGCNAPRSVVQVGSDIWFLGHRRGVCSIIQTEQNKLQGVDAPKSMDVQRWIDRINWNAARDSVAAVLENKVLFAVPLDSSTTNNAILVYSTITQSWQSIDTGNATNVLRWLKFTWDGATRLGYLSNDGFIYCLDLGYHDDTGDSDGNITHNEITTRLLTRGHGGETGGEKKFQYWTSKIRTANATVAVTATTDGLNEASSVETITKDRTVFARPHGAEAYDPEDATHDASTPYREDYSVEFPFVLRASPEGSGFDLLQSSEESGRLGVNGQSVQLEFVSTTGRMEIAGVTIESTRGSTVDGSRV